MNRRQFSTRFVTQAMAAAVAPAAFSKALAIGPDSAKGQAKQAAPQDPHAAVPTGPPQQIGMLLYPGMYPLDLVGPHAFLSGLMNVQVHLLWKTLDPVVSAQQLKLTPTMTLADCPKELDVIFVPGGSPGTILMMQDNEVLDFLADRGGRSRYVTSVCTGSLILGAAGLLKGYRATSHWNTRDILPLLGAIPVEQRVVEDRNRITGGGVTSGIDFGLVLASRLRDQTYAEMLQLVNEYDPQPPFHAGTPKQAGPALTSHIEALLAPSHERCRMAALAAQTRLGLA